MQKEKRVSEGEMTGWHHQCNGHELGQTLGDGEGQRGLACCSPWGLKESDMTGRLNNNNIVAAQFCCAQELSHIVKQLCSNKRSFKKLA